MTTLYHDDFGHLIEPYRRELQAHCYRMMGSLHDAEDMVQETFLRAWRHRESFEGRATVRAWLYKIATNICLDTLKSRTRKRIPLTHQSVSSANDPIPADVHDPIWLEPYPDDWLLIDPHTPEHSLASRENISMAFMAALHLLPPRQRAVLILRDVMDWQAQEVADLLDMSVSAVKSALYRARTTLAERAYPVTLVTSPDLDTPNHAHLAEYVRAWESADIPALLTLLTADATFSMPPIPSWYQGRESIGLLVAKTIFRGEASNRWRLLPTHANRQTAFGLYRVTDTPYEYSAYGIQLVTLCDGLIADLVTFRIPALVPRFGLPMKYSDK